MALYTPVEVEAPAQPMPDPADRASFGVRMRELLRWIRETLTGWMFDVAAGTLQNAQHAETQAGVAAAQAAFKGDWSSLSGALAKPAAVAHAGNVWILLTSIPASPGVQTLEPGVSAVWAEFDVGNNAEDILFDNSATAIAGTQVQAALVELDARATSLNGSLSAVALTAANNANAARVQRGTAVVTSSGTAVDMVSLPAADEYTLEIVGVTHAAVRNLFLVLGDSGGLETTGYRSTAARSNGAPVASTTAFYGYCGDAPAATPIDGSFTISRVSGNTWRVSHCLICGPLVSHGSGAKTLSGTLDRLQLNAAGAAFNGGTVLLKWKVAA